MPSARTHHFERPLIRFPLLAARQRKQQVKQTSFLTPRPHERGLRSFLRRPHLDAQHLADRTTSRRLKRDRRVERSNVGLRVFSCCAKVVFDRGERDAEAVDACLAEREFEWGRGGGRVGRGSCGGYGGCEGCGEPGEGRGVIDKEGLE